MPVAPIGFGPLLETSSEEISGASPEAYWRCCRNSLSLETNPNLGGTPKVDRGGLKDMMEEFENGLQRKAPLARGRKKRRASIPQALRHRVYERSGFRCVCGCGRACTSIHHVLPVGESITSWPELELVEANMVGCYWECNLAHHAAQPRFPLSCLPQCALELAAEVGPQAESYIARTYPE